MLDIKKIEKFYNRNRDNINSDIVEKIRKQGIYKPCFNQNLINNRQITYNIELPDTKIYDQGQNGGESYLCWIYAYLSFIKPLVCKKLNIADEDLDLSINYIHFFDRLEKLNNLYEEVIYNNLNLENNLNEKTISRYTHNQGAFDNVREIIQKYGIVPDEKMPMNINHFEPWNFEKILKEKMKKDVLGILKSKNIEEKEKLREKYLEENYVLLSKVYGQPPIKFDFKYKDTNKNEVQFNNITPKEFLEKCLSENLDDYIFVMNDNKKEFYKKYQYDDFSQIYNSNKFFYNLPIDVMKKATIKQLKEGIPVWFGCDFTAVCGTGLNKNGILDCNLMDLKTPLGIEILPRIEQEKFNHQNYNHAMVICRCTN